MNCKFCPNKELLPDNNGDFICQDCPVVYAAFVANRATYGNECWSFLTGNKIVFSSDKDAAIVIFDTEQLASDEWNYLQKYYRTGARVWAWARARAHGWPYIDIKAALLPCIIKPSCDKGQIEKCKARFEAKSHSYEQ